MKFHSSSSSSSGNRSCSGSSFEEIDKWSVECVFFVFKVIVFWIGHIDWFVVVVRDRSWFLLLLNLCVLLLLTGS